MKYFPHEVQLHGSREHAAAGRRLPIEFKLNGASVVGRAGRDHPRDRAAPRRRDPAPLLHAAACVRTATAAPAWSRSTASACSRPRAAATRRAGMKVHERQRARACMSQKMVLELLLSDMPRDAATRTDSELDQWAQKLGRRASRASRRATQPAAGPVAPGDRGQSRRLHPVHALPARLPRGAGATTSSATPGAASTRKIVFDFDDPMGASTCVACGECVQACPTGALMPAREARPGRRSTSTVDSVCPFCGVGCQLTYHVKDNTRSSSSTAATARPTTGGCASRAATASTTCTTRSA